MSDSSTTCQLTPEFMALCCRLGLIHTCSRLLPPCMCSITFTHVECCDAVSWCRRQPSPTEQPSFEDKRCQMEETGADVQASLSSTVNLDLVLAALTTEIHSRIFTPGTVGAVRHNIYKYSTVATTDVLCNYPIYPHSCTPWCMTNRSLWHKYQCTEKAAHVSVHLF